MEGGSIRERGSTVSGKMWDKESGGNGKGKCKGGVREYEF